MLAIQLINDQATINNFYPVDIKEYIPGQAFTFNFQILDDQSGNRFIPTNAATCTVTIQNSDGTETDIDAEFLFDDIAAKDHSFFTVSLTGPQATALVGGNFVVTVVDGANTYTGMAVNALAKITFDGDC